MINLFLDDGGTKAVEIGTTFLRIISPFYVFVGIKIMSDGALRGKGAMQYFMISTFTDLILRVVLAFVLARPYGSTGIWLADRLACVNSAVSGVCESESDEKDIE